MELRPPVTFPWTNSQKRSANMRRIGGQRSDCGAVTSAGLRREESSRQQRRWWSGENDSSYSRGFSAPAEDWKRIPMFLLEWEVHFMIDEPGRRRVDRKWIDDQGSVGRMKNIGRHVGSGPWPGAMRTEDPFEVTEVLNLISFKKDSSGRSAAGRELENLWWLKMRRRRWRAATQSPGWMLVECISAQPLFFIWRRCTYGVVRFRQQNHLVWVQKRSCWV